MRRTPSRPGPFWLLFAAPLGCASSTWAPPPPAGVTYVYDYQGFSEKGTTVVAGGVGGRGFGMGYGGAFSFRESKDLHGDVGADPFAESQPIDGVRFNEHLGNRGVGLAPPGAAPSPAAPPAPVAPPPARPPSAAPPSAGPAPAAPKPTAAEGLKL